MENMPAPSQRKWRPNLFDIALIVVVLVVAWVLLGRLGNRGGGGGQAAYDTVEYTIELSDMYGDSVYLIQQGDVLVDYVARRNMGTVTAVKLKPATRLEKNYLTGARVISEYPDRYNATLTVKADAVVTDTQITIPGGFVVRVGVWVSVTGPQYNASGYIVSIERDDLP